ncbi:MAG: hypothetical protein AAF721_29770 [Myxococcota bacterium]
MKLSDGRAVAIPTGGPRSGGRVLLAGAWLRRCEPQLRLLGHAVRTVSTKAEANRVLRLADSHFDAALLGTSLPDGEGLDLVQPLIDRRPLCKSIVVAESCANDLPARALRAGAQQLLAWPCGPAELGRAVTNAMEASRQWREQLGQRVEAGSLPSAEAGAHYGETTVALNLAEMVGRLRFLGDLTPMQTIVVWRILWGDGNDRIASLLGVTRRTVKYHVNQVLQRTGIESRGVLLRVLLEDAGVVDPWHDMDKVDR